MLTLNFRHSGNAGDVIYSIPAVQAICQRRQARPFLYLQTNVRGDYPASWRHPCGPYRMSVQMAEFLRPLIDNQPTFEGCKLLDGEPTDYNLDDFRLGNWDFRSSSLPRYYCYTFRVQADLSQPWLAVEPDENFRECLVVNRTNRYRNNQIDYSFLRRYKPVVFLGLAEEFKDFVEAVPSAAHVEAKDARQAAEIIAGARLFVGNQSFAFAVAEATKTPRVLEICRTSWNVLPEGRGAYEALGQLAWQAAIEQALEAPR